MRATALVTGASGGIGLEFARCFARDGHDVVLAARSQDRLEALAAELHEAHRITAHVLPVDLSEPGAAAKLVASLDERRLRIDYLVNNAGFGSFGRFVEIDPAEESGQIFVNVVALTELTRLLVPRMIERGNGRILNVASTAAFQPTPHMAVYGATKAYVLSFTESLGVELEGTGVTATCLCPGPTTSGFGERSGFVMPKALEERIPSSAEVAAYGYREMFAGKATVVHGVGNRLLTGSSRFAPRSVVAKLSGRMLSQGAADRQRHST